MGLLGGSSKKISSSSYEYNYSPSPSNPNPNDYQIIDAEQHGKFLIVTIKYTGCTNFEGKKILLYHNCTLLDLVKQKSIDPHFSNNKSYKSPIARFIPTDLGLNMARNLVKLSN